MRQITPGEKYGPMQPLLSQLTCKCANPFPQLSCDAAKPLQVLPKLAYPSQRSREFSIAVGTLPNTPAHAGWPCSSHHIWLLCCLMSVFCSWKLSSWFLEDIAHIKVQSMHFSELMRLSFPGTQSRSGCTAWKPESSRLSGPFGSHPLWGS